MNTQYLIDCLENYRSYQELKLDLEKILATERSDASKDSVYTEQLNAQIQDYVRTATSEQDDFCKHCGFNVDLSLINIQQLYSELKKIQQETEFLNGMNEAWESGDECDQATNDPGLQYEQSELVESLWNNFHTQYSSS